MKLNFWGCLSCKDLDSFLAKLHMLRLQEKNEEAPLMHYGIYNCPKTTKVYQDPPYREANCHTFAWTRTMLSLVLCPDVAEKYMDVKEKSGNRSILYCTQPYNPKYKDLE